MPTYDPLGGYATNPSPQPGSGAYGAVPGALTIPPNVYEQLTSLDPGLFGDTGSLPQSIKDEFGGLSPETIASIQQSAAQFGAKSGMPGSQFAGNYGLTQLGLKSEDQRSKAIRDAMDYAKLTGSQLTPQETALDVASRNATMAAAPNPRQAAEQQMSDWQNKFNAAAGGGAGGATRINPAGGSGGGGSRSPIGGPEPQDNTWYGATGVQTPAYNAPVNPRTGFYDLPTGNTYGNVSPTGQDQFNVSGGYGDYPDNTYYDSFSDTSNYDYGLSNLWGQYEDPWAGTIWDNNSAWYDNGYQPTSAGTMYMGDQSGYNGGYGTGGGTTYMGNQSGYSDPGLNDFLASYGYDPQGYDTSSYWDTSWD